jgi:formylglycine-generating enzyme required for sulfatase activity
MERLDYRHEVENIFQNLSEREQSLLLPLPELSKEESTRMVENLEACGFVKCPGGVVEMGLEQGLKCSIEGKRANETPQRELEVDSFYVSKTTVSNLAFEAFDGAHSRTFTSKNDKSPVTCVSYGRAISYAIWLNGLTGMRFSLPTEPQIVKAAAPEGWQYPYQLEGRPVRQSENVFKSYPEFYPEGEMGATLEVDDARVPTNYLGLSHSTGNVSVFTLGHYRTEGHWGAASDGAYSVVFGGNFRTCPFGSRVATRGIIDISAGVDTIGIRLVHPDPENYVRK